MTATGRTRQLAPNVEPCTDLSLRRDENENSKAKARRWSPTAGAQGVGRCVDLLLRRDRMRVRTKK